MDNRRQIAITRLFDRLLMVYMEDGRIYDVLAGEPDSDAPEVGDIYVGRVQNILQNIHAAFVEIKKGVVCYLPLSECRDGKLRGGEDRVVQIKKAAVRTKQPVATLYPELAGRFCVVSTRTAEKGISKKITDERERERLREMLAEFSEEEYGILLRTNAAGTEAEEIRRECRSLLGELHRCMEESGYRTGGSLIRKEAPFYVKYIRSCRMDELDRIITDSPAVYEELSGFCGDRAVFYQDEAYSLDKLLGLSSKLEKALGKKVWLKSGGSLVIEPTEALTVIDVNSSRAVAGKRSQETTFFRINCEAAREAARQIRMRNISGIILIDFIDMKERENQKKLMELLRAELERDKTRTALVDITKLGLVEITRMKVNRPLREALGLQGQFAEKNEKNF